MQWFRGGLVFEAHRLLFLVLWQAIESERWLLGQPPALRCVIQESMSLRYEPASEPLHISVNEVRWQAIESERWLLGRGKRGLLYAVNSPPPWRQPKAKSMISLVNSHTNATRIGWHLWEIDLGFAPGLPPGWSPYHLFFSSL